jgi:methylmalonyl-CoA/ethylmalonyl-CoA epimerase
MKPKLDHIGIAVTSLDEVRIYEALGLNVDHVEVVESQGVKTAFVPVGDSNLELLEPTRPDSPVARFMDKRGPGVHHICFRVANLDSELARLKAMGFRLVDEKPVPGAKGCRVAFLHPSASEGVLIELTERVGSHD